MGKKKETVYLQPAAQTNQQVVQTANEIKTPYSDAMRPIAQDRVMSILNGEDNSVALKGLMPVDEGQLLAERQAKRGADGMFALAAPDANANYLADRKLETDAGIAANRARGMLDMRKQALEYFNNMGFASEGRGIDAMAMKGGLLANAASNYTGMQQVQNSQRSRLDSFLNFGGAALSGAGMFL